MLCPGCITLDRTRALVGLLSRSTDFFERRSRVVEVAPLRGFQSLCLSSEVLDYTSFDLERRAMEQGDINNMKYATASVDYFVCFHVLEHIRTENEALREIGRVLKRGGTLLVQVPIDWSVETTYEYERPDPREVGHVRRYGRDFGKRLADHGFGVEARRVEDWFSAEEIARWGLGCEPVYFARKELR